MKTVVRNTGIAIALAWPETYCKQPGSWYDPVTLRLGFNKNHFYRVGHAAVVLIDKENLACHYFDFGRYHAPFQHGRVRGARTDHELKIHTIPELSEDGTTLVNFREILSELQHNKACHGEGDVYASYVEVNFQSAFQKANQMQSDSPIPYGPFLAKGSNCSRFVNSVLRAGKPAWKYRIRLKYFVPFTPTPMNNVSSLENATSLPAQLNFKPFIPSVKLDPEILRGTLNPPVRKESIPVSAQWLSGEGAGSWYVFEPLKFHIKVTRYSPEGELECSGLYKNQNGYNIVPDSSYRITYPSNCMIVSFQNGGSKVQFERVSD